MNSWLNINLKVAIKLIYPLLVIVGFFFLGILFEKKVIEKIKGIANKTDWKYDKIIINSIHRFSILWFTLAGIAIATQIYPIPLKIEVLINKALLATFLASVTLVISSLAVGLLKVYTTKEDGISPLTSLFEFITKIVIYSIGVLIILQSIGIQITPLLTALGVGGVSLGLALQTTLANLMSGINIIMSGKLKPGDYICLASGEKGYVMDIELKYTVLREITDNFLVIPNSMIISGSFQNFSLPNKKIVIPINIAVSYDSDLEKIEIVTLEVAKEALKNTIAIEDDIFVEPYILYNQFDYYSINFTIYLTINEQEFFEHLAIKHRFLKDLHKRYQTEGIEIPFTKYPYFIPQKSVFSLPKE
ncbi:MAG TPA: mechanosensitive ion channel protein MscS [Cyanothece sp. UBA12306]|nr:mechanosensitive ion channel protein MscS [Cyanothece sp. UBA12306]